MELGLIDRARRGDVAAFETLIEQRMDAVYRLCLAITGDPAEAADASQDAILAAWRGLPRLRQPDRFEAWFQRLVVNAARMRLRTTRRLREVLQSEIGSETLIVNAAVDDGMMVGEAMRRISAEQRTLLALHHVQGLGIAELAHVLGIPPGTVKSRLYAARQALASALESER